MLKIIAVYNLKWMLECLKPHKEPVVQALDQIPPNWTGGVMIMFEIQQSMTQHAKTFEKEKSETCKTL